MMAEEIPVADERPVRRFTTEEFHRIVEAGVLGDERVELLDGSIMQMLPISDPRIAYCVDRLNYLFARRLYGQDRPAAYLSIQNEACLSAYDDPVPDLVLKHPDARDRAPGPGEVLLLIEVATSSLSYDLGPKLRCYASHGIPEVWVVALDRARIYVYREPAGDAYRMMQTLGRGDVLTVAALPEVDPVAVDEVLGPAAS